MKALTYERCRASDVVRVTDVDPPLVGTSDILFGVYASVENTGN
ncbi:MAG: hypothetical protein ABJ050_18545 [Paracoccaceae bacterium]|jgi:hypothetical protein